LLLLTHVSNRNGLVPPVAEIVAMAKARGVDVILDSAQAIGYSLVRWKALTRYVDDGRLEMDNNAAERGMRAIALGRKNYLFVGSEAGGKAAAIAYTLIETAKLNAVDPHAWLADTLARIPDYKITKVDELLPWRRNR
jgi:hypothetical protein